MIREQAQRIFGLPIWNSLSPKRLEVELRKVSNLKKPWDRLVKKDLLKDDEARKEDNFYRNFMRNLMCSFENVLNGIPAEGKKQYFIHSQATIYSAVRSNN